MANAHQTGQWRTPPFKAQLRQWWRVAYAATHSFQVDVRRMRHVEGLLFGHAWLEDDSDSRGDKVAARKSQVRLRLDRLDEGKLRSWVGLEQRTVHHPETKQTRNQVGPHAYLGFGPLDGRGGTQLSEKTNAAIQAGEQATLAIAFPDEHAVALQQALMLMNRFGAVGGRSRNGWGSYSLEADNPDTVTVSTPLRPWKEALKLDWPHAIGSDEAGALIWQTPPATDWRALMRTLAEHKIGLRTQFEFHTGKDAPQPEARHWLAYPVTNHSVKDWGGDARLPNSLRFKVCPAPGDAGKVVGLIFHVPCLPPARFSPERSAIESVWQQVHQYLDEATGLRRAETGKTR